MAADIQQIAITDALTVHKPARHIAYTVQVSTPTRTWSVNRRYNDFAALDAELRSSTGKETPAPLPPKHWFARTMNDEEKIRQRRVHLEIYLRTILTTKDPRWRQAFGFADFLAVPAQSSKVPDSFSAASWLTEEGAVASLLRTARAALLKRDALARMGDGAGGRAASGDARKALREASSRTEALDVALQALSGLGDGERARRADMVAALRAEVANVGRMAEAGFRPARVPTPPVEAAGPGSSAAAAAPAGRVFGRRAAAQETAETRPLDDRGVVQLQQAKMANQDQQLGVLSGLLQRQRKMGEEIATEIDQQNEMLEHIDAEVTRVGGKMARAKRQMNRLG
ncbi:Vacuolar morphogenesis protein 7 [Vanrija pseudolonga]|uniref:Vacuolar morphogenesis protein 7 n=1 Tax=Vanrija pseudolonga TaxID=143232 RepID=A0AAF0YFD7_9TREE|nr:Vacuolar morphogenesis protein 7 [Vanrija pseudolonga]